jgi:hypothetical protein
VRLLLDDAMRELDRDLARADIVGTRHGHRPVSGDGRPLVGLTDIDGLSVATGTNRCGVVLAPLLAGWVIDEVLGDGPAPDNLYGAQDRQLTRVARWEDVSVWMVEAGRDLVTCLLDADGRLEERAEEALGTFLGELMVVAYGRTPLPSVDAGRTLIEALPLGEMIPELFFRTVGWSGAPLDGSPPD